MQKIIIIGATSGIGKELAWLFALKGNSIGITGRRNDLLSAVEKEISSTPGPGTGSIETACFDVMGSENIRHLKALIEKLGGLDMIIYNAGFGDPSPELDWQIDKKTIGVNVIGFLEIINWCFQYFKTQGRGHIVATSSIAANRGNSFAPAYSASKAFISCYLEGLHFKIAKIKIPLYVTDIQPGFVNTKQSNVKGQFWVVPLPKAARQIVRGIEDKRFRLFVSKRWRLIALLMKVLPGFIFSRFG